MGALALGLGGIGGSGGGATAGLSLEEIGSITPDWATHSSANTLAGDTTPGTGIDKPDRVPTDELWAIHVGDEDVAGENLYFFFANTVPDTGDAAGAASTLNNSAEILLGSRNVRLVWGQGDKLLVSRSATALANGTEITLYRVQPDTDDFARSITANLAANNTLTFTLTRDNGGNLSASVDLSSLVSSAVPNVPRWVSGMGAVPGDLSRDSDGTVYVNLTAITANSADSRVGPDGSHNWASVTGYQGDWTSGMYLHTGNVVSHGGIAYFVLADIGPSRTAPPSDATHFLPLGAKTNLTLGTRTATTLMLGSSTGDDVQLPAASATEAGLQSATDKAQQDASPPLWEAGVHVVNDQVVWAEKLYICRVARDEDDTDNPATDTTGWAEAGSGSGTGGETDLSVGDRTATTMDIDSSSGADATLPAASDTEAGLATAADRQQLDALPPLWAQGTHGVGDQVVWADKVYICLVARTNTHTDNPANDSTGWSTVGSGSGTGGSNTNLGIANRDGDSLDITSSTGTNVTVPASSATQAGLESAADKSKADASPNLWARGAHAVGDQVVWANKVYRCLVVRNNAHTDNPATDTTGWAEVGTGSATTSATDLSIGSRDADSLEIESSTGTNAEVPSATTTQAGLESAADKTKQDAYPDVWVAGTYQTGDQRVYNGKIYVRTGTAGTDTARQNPSSNTAWEELDASDISDASDTQRGIIETATQAEVNALTDTERAVTPGRLPDATATQKGLVELATQAEVTALSDTERAVTPGRLPISSESQRGLIELADNAQTDAGTDNAHAMTPAKVARRTGAKVSAAEITAGTETTVRQTSPADIVALARAHVEAGLDQAQVDARVVAGTLEQARSGNTARWPDAKIDEALTRDTELTAAIANFRTGTQITSEITTAIDAISKIEYKGDYSSSVAYDQYDVVTHEGATYLATQDVGANTQSTTEPGAGIQWRTHWDRLGYEDGPPNAFVDVTRDDQVLTFTRESEENPLELTLPPGGDSAYAFRYNTTPTLADSTTDTTIPTTGAGLRLPILAATAVTGQLQPDNDIVFQLEGTIEAALNGNLIAHFFTRVTLVISGKTLRFDSPIASMRSPTNYESVGMTEMSMRRQISLGSQTDANGDTITLTESDLAGGTTVQVDLYVQALARGDSPARTAANLTGIRYQGVAMTMYQLGAYKSGGGSSRGRRIATWAALPSTGNAGSATDDIPVAITKTIDSDEWVVANSRGVGYLDLPFRVSDESVIGFWLVGEEFNANGTVREFGASFLPFGILQHPATDESALYNRYELQIDDRSVTATESTVYIVSYIPDDDARRGINLRWPGNTQLYPANRRVVVYEAISGEPGKDGTTLFAPTDLGTHRFALTGATVEQALTNNAPGGDNAVIVCPSDGYIIATVNVPSLGFVGAQEWMFAEDLRAADSDENLSAGLYTNARNEIILHLAAQDSGASTGNEVIIQHIGTTDDESAGAEPVVLPSIARFDVTGNAHPVPGSIAGDRYGYALAISQAVHAASARIVGFSGGPVQSPSSVSLLHTVQNLHAEIGNITIPSGTSLASAGDRYTIRLEVYGSGKAPATDDPTAYHDFVITARAADVHFGTVVYDSDDSLAAHAARIVFADDDISTGSSSAGTWTFSGIPSTGEYIPYLAVPTSLPQPTRFTQSGFPITGITSVARTISGTAYRIYMYALDSRVDDLANNTSIVSYTS